MAFLKVFSFFFATAPSFVPLAVIFKIFMSIIISIFKIILILNTIILFIYSLFNFKIYNSFDKSVDKNEDFIKMASNKLFYIPFTLIIMSFLSLMVLNYVNNKSQTEALKKYLTEKNINKIPNTNLIIQKDNIHFIKDKGRVLVDSIYSYEKVTFKRDINDTTLYWIYFIRKDEPIANINVK